MILDPRVADAITGHLPKELAAFAAYRTLASWAQAAGYLGSARWFDAAGSEEPEHHRKLLQYLRDTTDAPPAPAYPALEVDFTVERLPDAYALAAALERDVRLSLQAIVGVARAADDEATARFIGTFLDEQVTAEAEIADILRQIGRLGDDALMLWDGERGEA